MNWTAAELELLEARVISLEKRVTESERSRMAQWRLIWRLTKLVAELSGVPVADLKAASARADEILQGWREGDAPRFGVDENDLD